MPKIKEVSNHPCHLLSLPSAKRFWCRHCMTVFEDAITRWHHSRSCRYGVVNNFMRRRELEAKALQNTTVLNPVEARLEHSIQMSDLASRNVDVATTSKQDSIILPEQDSFTCFICHQKFLSMEEMRMHVKFPCSNSKIITSHVPHPKHSVPVFIDNVPVRQQWQQSLHQQDQVNQADIYRQAHSHQSEQTNTDVKAEQELETNYDSATLSFSRDKNAPDTITPTNIYVNELGETVIEVENLDLNTEGAELSLAHLLTQLSQQGIVFDKTRTAELQCKQEMSVGGTSNILYTTETSYEAVIKEEEEQPTAEDAANTLAQLAGFRSFRNNQQTYEISTSDENEKTPIQTVEGYNYSDYIAGTTIMNSQSEMDVTYRYEYSESNEQCEETNVTGQASHQAQGNFENEKTGIGSETQIRVVYDSCSGKYVPLSGQYVPLSAPENSMEIDEVNCSADAPEENQVSEESAQEIIAEHCKTDHLTEAEENELNSGVLENNEVMVNAEENAAKSCSSPEEKVQETEDFTVPSLSLQEIVDTNNIEFEVPTGHQTGKTPTSMSQKPAVMVDEQTSLPLDDQVEPEQFSTQSSEVCSQENMPVFVETQTEMQALRENKS